MGLPQPTIDDIVKGLVSTRSESSRSLIRKGKGEIKDDNSLNIKPETLKAEIPPFQPKSPKKGLEGIGIEPPDELIDKENTLHRGALDQISVSTHSTVIDDETI